ncbi:MAG: MFS transporter [Elusimicrobia bacterium]|nr:MFS transporter [Elusimicrobiota bacterium]
MKKTALRLIASTLCSAIVWASPGLEAYAAEGRAIDIRITPAINGAGAAVRPVQLTLKGLETPPGGAFTGLAAGQERFAAGFDQAGSGLANPAATGDGLLKPQGVGQIHVQLPFAFDHADPILIPQPGARPAIVSGAKAAPVVDAPDSYDVGRDLSFVEVAGRIANVHRIGQDLRDLKDYYTRKASASLSEPGADSKVSGPVSEQTGPAKSPEAKLEASPAQAPPEAKGADVPPSTPPTTPVEDGGKGKKPNSPWRNAYIFIAGLIVAQVGVEAWSAAWAKWVQTNFNTPTFDAYTTVTLVAMGTSLVAGFIGGWLTDKLGLKRTFIGTLGLVAAAAATMLVLFQMHILTAAAPALLIGLVVARAFFNSANGTAQQTVPIAIFKDDKAAFQKYNSSSQFILEIAGIAVPYGIGALLGMFGFVGTMWIMPAALAAAVVILALFLRIADVKKSKGPAKEKTTDPGLLKIAIAGYPALVLLNYLLYAVIAIGYGNFLHPGTTLVEQAAASGVAGKIVSLYSAGGLIAAAILSGVPQAVWKWLKSKWPWLNKKAEAVAAKLPARFKTAEPAKEDPHADAKSAAKWLIFSAIGMAGFIPLLFSSPLLCAIAMIPFGITNVMSTLQLISIAQSNTPQDKKGKVMGIIRTIATALATGGIFGFSKLFKLYPGSHFPFVIFLALGGVLAAYYVFTSIRLRRHIKSHDPASDGK